MILPTSLRRQYVYILKVFFKKSSIDSTIVERDHADPYGKPVRYKEDIEAIVAGETIMDGNPNIVMIRIVDESFPNIAVRTLHPPK